MLHKNQAQGLKYRHTLYPVSVEVGGFAERRFPAPRPWEDWVCALGAGRGRLQGVFSCIGWVALPSTPSPWNIPHIPDCHCFQGMD